MQSIRVSIYEDNDKLRDLIGLLITNTESFNMVGAYPDCINIEAQTRATQPDVIIMDIDMPRCNGIEGVRKVKLFKVDIKILMHTAFDDDDKLFACLRNGADGYLLKKDSSDHLLPAIREVFEGGAPMSPGIARKVLQEFHSVKPKADYHISERERQVLELLSKGFSYRMIALEILISPETVKRHLKNIYTKLHVQCGPEAVAKAIRERII